MESIPISRSRSADDLRMQSPPLVKTPQPGTNYKDDNTLSSMASESGYFYYHKNISQGNCETKDTTTKIVTIISMFFVFMMVGWPSLKNYVSVYTAFHKISGTYTNDKFNYSVSFPDGWRAMKKPQKMLRVNNAAGFFAKGNRFKPDIQMLIYYGGNGAMAPEQISPEILDYLEPQVKSSNEYYANMMGMNYELMGMNLIDINNRDALWIEGNIWCRGCEVNRDFTFYAFGANSSYYIKFIFPEHRVDDYWPEIKEMLSSITLN